MKPLALSLVLLALVCAPLAADQPTTTTTTYINLGGIINCQAITLTATRVQTTTLRTSVDLTINDCAPGETVPHHNVPSFRSDIPNGDLTHDTCRSGYDGRSPQALGVRNSGDRETPD